MIRTILSVILLFLSVSVQAQEKKFEKKIKYKEKTDKERYISALRKAGLN